MPLNSKRDLVFLGINTLGICFEAGLLVWYVYLFMNKPGAVDFVYPIFTIWRYLICSSVMGIICCLYSFKYAKCHRKLNRVLSVTQANAIVLVPLLNLIIFIIFMLFMIVLAIVLAISGNPITV